MSNGHECELQQQALKPPIPEGAIQWTDKLPIMPGWYWLQRAILRHNEDAWHEVYPVLVEVAEDKNGSLGLYMPGLDHVWSFDDVVIAEWAGPLRPSTECRRG